MSKKKSSQNKTDAVQLTELDDDQKEFLIESVNENPPLWDPTSAGYSLLGKKQTCWLNIDETFATTYPGNLFGGFL